MQLMRLVDHTIKLSVHLVSPTTRQLPSISIERVFRLSNCFQELLRAVGGIF